MDVCLLFFVLWGNAFSAITVLFLCVVDLSRNFVTCDILKFFSSPFPNAGHGTLC